jgi:hypothetical protein
MAQARLYPPCDLSDSLCLDIDPWLDRMYRIGFTNMDVAMSSAYTFCHPFDMIEQFCGGVLRPHQGRFDAVLVQQPEQILHQSAGGVVIDKEFFAVEFGAAVDEGGDATARSWLSAM